jgi:CRP-like cAMP-binding protein
LERVGADVSNSKLSVSLTNHLLLHLPESDRESLLRDAQLVHLSVGHTLARTGDQIAWAFFPESGVISLVREMTTGHQLAVTAIGPEGLLGFGSLLGMRRFPLRFVVLVESRGYRITTDRLNRVFEQSDVLRRTTLSYVGRKLAELAKAAACTRVHSHRQRLARWLLDISDKAGECSLPMTHETLALMVGGPRHAVTVALKDLRAKGAIAHLRGRIDIVKRSALIVEACECYAGRPRESSW